MKVRVSTRRIGGRLLSWNEQAPVYEGTLLSGRKGADDRAVVTLFLGGLEGGPSLYDPKVVSSFGTELRFIGLERWENAWVLQEWNCEIVSLSAASQKART